MKRKSMLWGGLGVVAAAIVVFFAVLNPRPADENLQGSIGVAKQYRADQIGDADVVLEDPEIQQLLQSDFFHKLVTDQEFRSIAVDQLARLDMATQRNAQLTNTASLTDMKQFLDLTAANADLKQALAEGRMNVVSEILVTDGKASLMDVANRIYVTQSRHPQLNATALGDMKIFLDNVVVNADLKAALTEGRMDIVNEILVKDGKASLEDAAQRILLAESRQHELSNVANLADMKVFLNLAIANGEMRQAMAEGRMNLVSEMLVKDGKANLAEAANRLYLALGKHPQLTSAELSEMKNFLDLAIGDGQMRAAMSDGRMEIVNDILVKDGKANLAEAANRISLAQSRHSQLTATAFADMKIFLDLVLGDASLKAAMTEGRMDVVNEILVKDGKANLADAANRIYFTQSRNAQLSAVALNEMKIFLDNALDNASLKAAMTEGRMDLVNEVLVKDGKANLQDAAQRVFLTESRHAQLGSVASISDFRAITEFAAVNADFAQNLQSGNLDGASRVALSAGKYEISLRNLQIASYIVGNNRNFVPEFSRLVAVADSPAFRMVADQPGFDRLVNLSSEATWRQTLTAVSDGKMAMQQS